MILFFILCCILFLIAVVMIMLPEIFDPEEKHSGVILLAGIGITILLNIVIVILVRGHV